MCTVNIVSCRVSFSAVRNWDGLTHVSSLSSLRMSNLTLIKWEDEDGEIQSFKLLEMISSKWWDAGIRLGLTIDALENYKQKTEDNDKRLEYIFWQWIDDNGHQEYQLTWKGLSELLRDIDKDSAAEELIKVLENRGIKVEA